LDLAGVIWHFASFFMAPLGLGVIASLLAKLLWRSSLRSVPWSRLAGFACGAAFAAHVVGLVLLGTDGKMLTYAAMVLATATALWWAGRPRSSKG
jgi:Na+/citrate or Na+/malate symporter